MNTVRLRGLRPACLALLLVLATWGSAIAGSNTAKVGQASWYGREFGGRRTASGERFDPNGMTGAHRTLPMGSVVRVTNLRNGRSITVKITDRGPFRYRREIDLSLGAARALGFANRGVERVLIEPM